MGLPVSRVDNPNQLAKTELDTVTAAMHHALRIFLEHHHG